MKSFRWKELAVGLVLGGLFFFPWGSLLETEPYSNVDVISVSPVEDAVVITANFRKNECTFNRLEVFGSVFGALQFLTWENVVVGAEEDRETDYDRSKGDQTLRIKVYTKSVSYDKIEIRTRHTCSGKTLDKVFSTIHIGALNGQ